jgi:hypothetical protein
MDQPAERPQAYYDAIKDRFAEARDLRLKHRPQGTAQYTSDFSGPLSRYADDPHADDLAEKPPPMNNTSTVSMMGA